MHAVILVSCVLSLFFSYFLCYFNHIYLFIWSMRFSMCSLNLIVGLCNTEFTQHRDSRKPPFLRQPIIARSCIQTKTHFKNSSTSPFRDRKKHINKININVFSGLVFGFWWFSLYFSKFFDSFFFSGFCLTLFMFMCFFGSWPLPNNSAKTHSWNASRV